MRRVIDLRFCQRRLAMDAPMHWFLTSIHHTLLDEFTQCPDDCGLVAKSHRQVGFRPSSEYTQALEVFTLHANVGFSVSPVCSAEIGFT